ncbi:reverse transcriptase domain-containing protein [Tanacetum coccineum]
MSTRSSTTKLVAPFSNPESVIRNRRRNLGELSLLIDFEEINMSSNNQNQNMPPTGPIPQNPAPNLRMMEELCQPTMLGWGGLIAPMTMHATDFGLKNHMILQVQQSCQYHGLPGYDANKHIDKFSTVNQNMKQNGVLHDVLRLCLFPYSLTHHATAWFDRLPKNSIHSWEEMVTKFLSKYFPPSMVTKLRNDISNFRQLHDESLFKAWERYKLSIDRCPNHNMLPVTQIDTLYNGLTLRHRDTINAAAGGTFMKRRPEDCYDLIKNMTAHHNDWDTSAQRGESSRSITYLSPEIAALTQQIAKSNKIFLRMSQSNQQVNVVNPSCETCGGPHHYSECQAASGFTQGDVYAATGNYNAGANQMTKIKKAFNERPQGALHSNTIPNPREEIKVITTRSGITLAGPLVPPPNPPSSSKEVERDPEPTMDHIPERNPHQPPIPYPLRLNKDKLQDKFDIQIHKYLQMFKKLHFNISFAEALALPKYAKMLKDLLTNKEKLLELANTPLNENFSVVLLKKLPEKLGDPGCQHQLNASIYVEKLMLPELITTHMTLKLANRSVAYPASIAEDVFLQVGKFTFPADLIVVNYDVDPRVPLILGRPFLRTAHALVYVHEEELILRVKDEKLTFNVDSTLKYPHKHGNESINIIDIIDTTCEDHFPEVLTIQKLIYPLSGSPTHSSDPIVASLSPSLTPSGIGDILLLEKLLNIDSTKDLPPQELNNDPKGDILFLENLLKDEPSEIERSEIYPLIGDPSDTFLIEDEEIKFITLKDIDDPVPIPRVSETPLDSLASVWILLIRHSLILCLEFDSEYTLNYDNPIFDIQNEDSDESKIETIMDEGIRGLESSKDGLQSTDISKIIRKTVKNGQTRTQERKSVQKPEPKPEKVKSPVNLGQQKVITSIQELLNTMARLIQSNQEQSLAHSHDQATSEQGKHTRIWVFVLFLLREEAQVSLTWIASLAICVRSLSDPTAKNKDLMIRDDQRWMIDGS